MYISIVIAECAIAGAGVLLFQRGRLGISLLMSAIFHHSLLTLITDQIILIELYYSMTFPVEYHLIAFFYWHIKSFLFSFHTNLHSGMQHLFCPFY